MRPHEVRACLAVTLPLLAAALGPAPALASWPHDLLTGNVPICTAAGVQNNVSTVADGAGGVFLAWQDARSGTGDIYAQHLDATGVAQWSANGVVVCNALNDQTAPTLVLDAAGGVIISWSDARSSATPDIYAQRLNASGVPQWTANGVVVCNLTGNQYLPITVADGSGGAIITWYDKRSGTNYDIYSQRLNSAGSPQWTLNGVAVCNAAGDQFFPRSATDGVGGVFVTWQDARDMTQYDVYVQRLNSAGTALLAGNGLLLTNSVGIADLSPVLVADGFGGVLLAWQSNYAGNYDIYCNQVSATGVIRGSSPGFQIGSAAGDQLAPAIVTDGNHGAIVTWTDYRSGNADVYAQRIENGCSPRWASNGVPVSTGVGNQNTPALVADGLGGVILAWLDDHGALGYDIYAQQLNSSGIAQWAGNGIALSTAAGDQVGIAIDADGANGAIAAWSDGRTAASDLYAQRVDRYGQIGSPEAAIIGHRDVINDQGGAIKLTWNASYLDAFPAFTLGSYLIWRQVPGGFAQQALRSGAHLASMDDAFAPVAGSTYLTMMSSAQVTYWEYLATLPADGQTSYSYVAATTSDSIAGSNPYTSFMIEARAASGTGRWYSAPDSGYSVDNLPPASPSPFTGAYATGSTTLAWGASSAPDFATFRLCRGTTAGFAPGSANLVATTTNLGFVDAASQFYFYKLAAEDIHGNLSPFALVQPTGSVGVDGGALPAAQFLSAPSPNPARGATALRFGLPVDAQVSMTLFDQQGRNIRSLVEARLGAGEHVATWDGCDRNGTPVVSGLYFVRLRAAGRTFTQRIVAVR